ncbi:MAG: DUF3047 domain-containing protein [bacterium]|nr:DUF3047 domain-containing protein [bacterium]
MLVTKSNNSASSLMLDKDINVYQTPKMHWRWKVDNILTKGDVRFKESDDLPIRIYVVFKGRFLKISTLNYVWANKQHSKKFFTSTYSDKVKIIIMQDDRIGSWQKEEVDIVEDYLTVFGTKPPKIAKVFIMSDSDNTGGKVTAYLDYLDISA